jgi:hypothetical protein
MERQSMGDRSFETEGHVTFIVDRVVVLVWKKPPELPGVEHCGSLFRAMDRFGYLVVVQPNAGTQMPGPVRTELSAMLRAHEKRIIGSAIAFEGKGFGAAIVRSVVSAIQLALQPPYPVKVTSDVLSAAQWLTDTMRMRGVAGIDAPTLISSVNKWTRMPSAATGS